MNWYVGNWYKSNWYASNWYAGAAIVPPVPTPVTPSADTALYESSGIRGGYLVPDDWWMGEVNVFDPDEELEQVLLVLPMMMAVAKDDDLI